MAINIINVGGADAFDALLYPQQHQANQMYFQNQIQAVGNTLTDMGRRFIEASRDVYDTIYSSEAARIARTALRSVKGIFHSNHIAPLETLEEIQSTSITMQRWVMACPEIRELYHQQRCEGYSDTYVDAFPGLLGENHYDWRRVMDGVVVEDEDGWYARFYPDELLGQDHELNHDEKVAILSTWDIIRGFVDQGLDDPTSPYGSKL